MKGFKLNLTSKPPSPWDGLSDRQLKIVVGIIAMKSHKLVKHWRESHYAFPAPSKGDSLQDYLETIGERKSDEAQRLISETEGGDYVCMVFSLDERHYEESIPRALKIICEYVRQKYPEPSV